MVFLKRLWQIFLIPLSLIIMFFTALGIFYYKTIINDLNNHRVISSNIAIKTLAILDKKTSYIDDKYPNLKRSILGKKYDGIYAPSINYWWEKLVETEIQDGTKISIPPKYFPLYGLIIDPDEIRHSISVGRYYREEENRDNDYGTSQIIELRFKNAVGNIYDVALYNPSYTGFWDPFPNISYQILWFNHLISYWNGYYRGDFCFVLHTSAIIDIDQRQDFPDCNLLHLARRYDYKSLITMGISSLDQENPAEFEAIYHQIDHNQNLE